MNRREFWLVLLFVSLCIPVDPAFSQLDFWKTIGPYGGYVTSLAINPINGFIFAGTYQDGIFRSFDNGENWQNWIHHQCIYLRLS